MASARPPSPRSCRLDDFPPLALRVHERLIDAILDGDSRLIDAEVERFPGVNRPGFRAGSR